MTRKAECDSCGEVGIFNLGHTKNGKPEGWGYMVLEVKVEKGVNVTTHYDLCPTCTELWTKP